MELTYTNKSDETGHPKTTWSALAPWLIAMAGLLSMYGPTFWDLFHGLWAGEQQGHGPIILGISMWLLWKKWDELNIEDYITTDKRETCMFCKFKPLCIHLIKNNFKYDENEYYKLVSHQQLV